MIPKDVRKKLFLIVNKLVWLLSKTDNNLIDNTGSTQGIKFKMNPPKKANKKIYKYV